MIPPPRRYAAVDLGAESGRVMVGTLTGARLELAEVHRFSNRPVRVGPALHWEVLRLWDEIKHGLAVAAAGGTLVSLGVDGWGVDFALLDAHEELLGNPRHYRDARTEGMLEAAWSAVPREEIFERTGIQFMRINTLYQLLAMRRAASPQLTAAHTLLMIPDLINFWLTGRKVCEFTNATTTQCYDPRAGDWARPLLERLGLPTALFGEIVPPGTVLGPLRADLADELGFTATVVAPATHDTGSAVVAIPATGNTHAYLSSGTWSLMGIEVDEPIINARTLELNFTNEGGVQGRFRLLKNIMGLWLVQECRRAWRRAGLELSYDELTAQAAAAPPLAALIDPDHETFLAPADMPSAIAGYCLRTQQRVPGSPGEIVRCALESLALKYRQVLEQLDAIAGRRHEVIHIVGGGSQNQLLNQLTADACGRPVIAGPVEATALGNLVMQGLALGELESLAHARTIIRNSFTVTTFPPGPNADWGAAADRWRELLQ